MNDVLFDLFFTLNHFNNYSHLNYKDYNKEDIQADRAVISKLVKDKTDRGNIEEELVHKRLAYKSWELLVGDDYSTDKLVGISGDMASAKGHRSRLLALWHW